MKDISDLISSVGFPIVVTLIMIYQQEKMSDSYIEIVNSLKDLISDNTKAINIALGRFKNIEEEENNNGKIIQETKDALQSDGQNK